MHGRGDDVTVSLEGDRPSRSVRPSDRLILIGVRRRVYPSAAAAALQQQDEDEEVELLQLAMTTRSTCF